MCKMRVVVLREMLGNRELCWTLWNGKEVMELTARQIKDNMKKGEKICGLMIGKSGELEFDRDGFFTTNIMEHRHCGNYVPMVAEDCMANMFYIVIGSHTENEKVVYDCISTKFEQIGITESDLRAYLKIGIVSGGAKLEGDNIVLASLEYPKEEDSKKEVAKQPNVEKVAEKKVETPKAKNETANKK